MGRRLILLRKTRRVLHIPSNDFLSFLYLIILEKYMRVFERSNLFFKLLNVCSGFIPWLTCYKYFVSCWFSSKFFQLIPKVSTTCIAECNGIGEQTSRCLRDDDDSNQIYQSSYRTICPQWYYCIQITSFEWNTYTEMHNSINAQRNRKIHII